MTSVEDITASLVEPDSGRTYAKIAVGLVAVVILVAGTILLYKWLAAPRMMSGPFILEGLEQGPS